MMADTYGKMPNSMYIVRNHVSNMEPLLHRMIAQYY